MNAKFLKKQANTMLNEAKNNLLKVSKNGNFILKFNKI